MIERFIQNSWYGGITNDEYIGTSAGSFYDCHNIDTKKNSKYFKLGANYDAMFRKFEVETGNGGTIIAILNILNTQNLLFLTGGKVRNAASSTTDRYTASTTVLNAGTTPTYGFIIKANGYIDRWTLSTAVDGGLSTAVSDYLDITITNGTIIIQDNIYIYIAGGGTIKRIAINTSSWVVDLTISIDTGFTVSGMSKIGDQIIIYATDGANGAQFYWDGISAEYQRKISWYDKPVLRTVNINNIDYIITGGSKKRQLYRVNGYTPEPLYMSQFINNETEKLFFKPDYVNAIETVNNNILIPGQDCLYSYGTSNPNLPWSLIREFEVRGNITALSYNEINPYSIFCATQSSHTGTLTSYIQELYLRSEPTVANIYSPIGGYIEFNPIIDVYSGNKASKKIRVGYSMDNDSTLTAAFKIVNTDRDFQFDNQVTILERKDDETIYSFYIGNVTTAPTVGATYTIGSNTYTITNVFLNVSAAKYYGYISCTLSGSSTPATEGSLTKTAGTGDSTIYYCKIIPYRVIKTLRDYTKKRFMFQPTGDWNKIQFAIDVTTADRSVSPKVYDFIFLYDIIDGDL